MHASNKIAAKHCSSDHQIRDKSIDSIQIIRYLIARSLLNICFDICAVHQHEHMNKLNRLFCVYFCGLVMSVVSGWPSFDSLSFTHSHTHSSMQSYPRSPFYNFYYINCCDLTRLHLYFFILCVCVSTLHIARQ